MMILERAALAKWIAIYDCTLILIKEVTTKIGYLS
jgi:hypothetical protein